MMDSSATRSVTISAEQVERYDEDGVVCLRGVIGTRWLDLLAQGVEKDLTAPGPLHTVQQASGEPGFFLTDFCMSQRLLEFREFVLNSPAAEIAALITGSSRINFFYDAIWVKEQGTPKRTRWHQDQPYYPVDGHQFCGIWLPLDPLPETASLELVRGSHRWGRWFEPELTRDGNDLYPTQANPFERMPDIEADRSAYEIVSFAMTPGDCLVFHALTVHGSPGNASTEHRRRAVSTFWMGDDASFAERPGPVRPLFEGHGLEVGDAMDCDYFPRVWPAGQSKHPLELGRFADPGFTISI